jgi:hypothetical protein
MEYIEGVPITQYCDGKRMTIAQRLELFLAVCHAIQHAHQKGLIHRDLKLLSHNQFHLGGLHSAWVRGQAFIASHRYAEAAGEFQKILDHRGIVGADPVGPLAHLQLARVWVLSGDKTRAKAAYEDFLALWKDGDPTVPILKSARAEYSGLQ